MKILVITDLYPIKENEKDTPKTIQAFVNEWQKQGHEVLVIKPNFLLNSFIRKKPFYKSGIYENVENINYWLPFVGKVSNKIHTEFAPDIVIAHMPSGLLFANHLKSDFTAAVHSSDIEVLTNPLYRFYFKPELEKAYKNAKKIACRSFVLKDKFLKLYPEYSGKTFTAVSGIDFEPIKRNWSNNDKIKILTCGKLIERKNIDKVIMACSKLENVELTVIGSGSKYKELKRLSGKTVFAGQIPHEEVLKKMRESDIFILPSVKETFGMVYLEAMASGCITVCTENDGIDGIIKDGINGFTTTPEKVEETLIKIINLEDKNSVLENSFNTISEYSAQKAADNYLKNILN